MSERDQRMIATLAETRRRQARRALQAGEPNPATDTLVPVREAPWDRVLTFAHRRWGAAGYRVAAAAPLVAWLALIGFMLSLGR